MAALCWFLSVEVLRLPMMSVAAVFWSSSLDVSRPPMISVAALLSSGLSEEPRPPIRLTIASDGPVEPCVDVESVTILVIVVISSALRPSVEVSPMIFVISVESASVGMW